MIDALLAGRVHGTPTERTAKNGARFVTCKLRVATRTGETLFANIICFRAQAVTALLALSDGDSVAISGELTLGTYVAKDGITRPTLDVVAHAALSPYSVARKRQALSASRERSASSPALAQTSTAEFDDDLPVERNG